MNQTLQVTNLSKSYNSGDAVSHALRDVSMSVEEGDFVALMGPSGCGKTTLLNLIAGLDDPISGEIDLAGHRMDTLSEGGRAVVRRGTVGFVFQAYNLISNLTASDNVELPGLLAGLSQSEARARREELFAQLGIEEKASSAPSELSGGEQQRVAVARALINRPAILLADEPTGNLDSASSTEMMRLLRSYNADGQTILMVTHNPRIASSAGRVIRMQDGQIADEMTISAGSDSRSLLSTLIDLEA